MARPIVPMREAVPAAFLALGRVGNRARSNASGFVRQALVGDIAEFGVFKGGTTLLLARFARHWGLGDARVFGFDTFGGVPPRRSVFDLYARPGRVFTDVEAVRRLCASDPWIELVVGAIVSTRERITGRPLVFDTDNYSPVRAALELCIAQTVVGGSIVFDHLTSIDRFRYTIIPSASEWPRVKC